MLIASGLIRLMRCLCSSWVRSWPGNAASELDWVSSYGMSKTETFSSSFFFQAEDGIRALYVTGFRRVLFRFISFQRRLDLFAGGAGIVPPRNRKPVQRANGHHQPEGRRREQKTKPDTHDRNVFHHRRVL